ncbi:MAG TPA: formate dehydrogenase accessory protein FdhE [Rhodopila sp.]|nr:formate dehydrogenase accessory protein FdhE [Rhodopila sp.]
MTGDLPRDGIGQPDPVILADPTVLFARRAERLRVLAVGHPMADWLRFLSLIADAQQRACASPLSPWPGSAEPVTAGNQTLDGPPLPAETIRPDATFDTIVANLVTVAADPMMPEPARSILSDLTGLDVHAVADGWLTGTLSSEYAGHAVPIAAALQVWFARRAAALDVGTVHLLPQRGLCPVCASAPVAGLITAKGKTPGARYLHCGLCATAWNFVRASCTGCGESKGLALQEVEGGSGAVKAETCDVCHGYAKMFYQAKDMAIEPLADDLGSLGLDLMISDAGWSRLAPNPLLLAAR